MASGQTYDVHALRYGTRASKKSAEYFRYDLYDLPDEDQQMDYYFWLVRNNDRTILVDCGFDKERGATKKRYQQTDPLELLARMDVAPGDVDHVVISHMHYDHVGNAELFPNATFSLTREEFDFWTGPYGQRQLMTSIVLPEERRIIESLHQQERVHLVDSHEEILPGIVVTRLGGHTPGQAMVEVATKAGGLVLATDAMHYYEEVEQDWPFKLFDGLGDMYRAFDVLRDLGSRPDKTLIAGHDPRVAAMFDHTLTDCIDLTAPVESE